MTHYLVSDGIETGFSRGDFADGWLPGDDLLEPVFGFELLRCCGWGAVNMNHIKCNGPDRASEQMDTEKKKLTSSRHLRDMC